MSTSLRAKVWQSRAFALAPSLNPLTPIIVAIPILGLYLVGIALAWLVERGRRSEAEGAA